MAKHIQNEPYTTTGISIPQVVHQAVKALAIRERRSVSAQIGILLELALKCQCQNPDNRTQSPE